MKNFAYSITVSVCLMLLTACANTNTSYQNTSAKPSKPDSSGVQVYGVIDMGYSHTRQKVSK